MNQLETLGGEQMFGPLPVNDAIARALQSMRFSTPTPIQERAIPVLREGRDVLAQAQTGTGKTAGFGIPLIEAIQEKQRGVQAIVLVPTRELCLQVTDELNALGQYARVRVLAVYGGVGFGKQLEGLRRGSEIVVGTPGRVEDLIARGDLRLGAVRFAILDEADRMLDVGFLPAIERILRNTPASRQTGLFSATIPNEIRGLANRQMRDAVSISVDPERATVDEIEQRFEHIDEAAKLDALSSYLDDSSCYLALVFRRTTYKADRLVRDLARRGYKVAALHGRKTQGQRERVLADLKAGKLQALVATDIAARGLDITGLTHVFNYDLPDTPETYVHRIGRTGRAGESGTAITFVTPDDQQAFRALQRFLARRTSNSETHDQAPAGAQRASSARPPRRPSRPQAAGQRNNAPRPPRNRRPF